MAKFWLCGGKITALTDGGELDIVDISVNFHPRSFDPLFYYEIGHIKLQAE